MPRAALLVCVLATATPALAAAPIAHYDQLTPRSWAQRLGRTIQSLIPKLRKTQGRARAVALAEAHDRYLAESHATIGDAILGAARSALSTIDELEYRGNRVIGDPIVGGEAIGQKLGHFIGSAKKEVLLQSYVFEKSWMADQVTGAIAKLPASAETRALVHPRGAFAFGLLPTPVTETRWMTLHRLRGLFPSRVKLGAWRLRDLFGTASLHDKGVIVDGERAFITDANVQRTVDPVAHGGLGWFQLGLEVEGPIAGALRADMLDAWKRAYPNAEVPEAPAKAAPKGDVRMIFLGKSSASGGRASSNLGMAALFLSARKKVRVLTPNLNDDAAILALAAATAHSDVEIVLSKGFNEKAEWVGQGGGNARNVRRLRDMAVDPSHLHVHWFTGEDGVTPVGNGLGPSHAKYASADGKVMIFGSQNQDTQSYKRSREAGVAVDDATTTAKYDAVFDQVFARSRVAYEP